MQDENILNKVKNISTLINNTSNTNNTKELDIEKISKAINTFKLLNQNNTTKKDDLEDNTRKFSLENKNIKTIKSVLPLIELEDKNNVGKFIEIMEANHIVTQYKNFKKSDDIEKISLKKEAILAIKPHLEEQNKHFLDLMFKILEINEITNKINFRKEEQN